MFISYNILSLIIFVLCYAAYYFYSTAYRPLKEARKLLEEKKYLKQLLPYFSKHGSCHSESAIQGKDRTKNFYEVKDRGSYYECTLWVNKTTLNIKKNAPFAEVKKVIEQSISEINNEIEEILRLHL